MTTQKQPRIVLITSGPHHVANYFATLPGTPIGIVYWNDKATKHSSRLGNSKLKNAIHARLRGRQFASLEHLCSSQNLLYADIYKRDTDTLHSTLTKWQCDLVVTSRCSIVPLAALPDLSHGTLNMHPSWLPDYRGGNPILWQIIDNEKELATSIHRLTDKYDRGAVLAQKRTSRPHAASKTALLDITDGVLGRELLADVIQSLIDDPMTQGIEQPVESPTRYAYGKTPDALASENAIDSFSEQSLWDLIHYIGHCPDRWLALSGWRKRFEWRPARMHQHEVTTDRTPWRIHASGLSVQLHNDHATIELKPHYLSLLRRLRT